MVDNEHPDAPAPDKKAEEGLLATLNTLIEVSQLGEWIFGACARHAQSAELHALLDRRASEYRQATTELHMLALRRGLEPQSGDGILSTVSSVWPVARHRWTQQDDQRLIEECGDGEDVALRHFADAIAVELPANVHAVVRRQIEGVTRFHDQFRSLRSGLGTGQAMA